MKKTLLSVAISSLVVATSANAALNDNDAAAVHQYLSKFHNVPAYVYGALTDNATSLTDVNNRLKGNSYWDGSNVISLQGTVSAATDAQTAREQNLALEAAVRDSAHHAAQNTLAQGHNNPEGITAVPAPALAPVAAPAAPIATPTKAPVATPAAVPTLVAPTVVTQATPFKSPNAPAAHLVPQIPTAVAQATPTKVPTFVKPEYVAPKAPVSADVAPLTKAAYVAPTSKTPNAPAIPNAPKIPGAEKNLNAPDLSSRTAAAAFVQTGTLISSQTVVTKDVNAGTPSLTLANQSAPTSKAPNAPVINAPAPLTKVASAAPAPLTKAAYVAPVAPSHLIEQATPAAKSEVVAPATLTKSAYVAPTSKAPNAPVINAPASLTKADYVAPSSKAPNAPVINAPAPLTKVASATPAPLTKSAYVAPVAPSHLIEQATPAKASDVIAPATLTKADYVAPTAKAPNAPVISAPAAPSHLIAQATPLPLTVATVEPTSKTPNAPAIPAAPKIPGAEINVNAPNLSSRTPAAVDGPTQFADVHITHIDKEPQHSDAPAAPQYLEPNHKIAEAVQNLANAKAAFKTATGGDKDVAGRKLERAQAALVNIVNTETRHGEDRAFTAPATSTSGVANALQQVGAAASRVQAAQNNLAQQAANNPNALNPSAAQQRTGGNLVTAQNNLAAAQNNLTTQTAVAQQQYAAAQAAANQAPPAPTVNPVPATPPTVAAAPAAPAPAANIVTPPTPVVPNSQAAANNKTQQQQTKANAPAPTTNPTLVAANTGAMIAAATPAAPQYVTVTDYQAGQKQQDDAEAQTNQKQDVGIAEAVKDAGDAQKTADANTQALTTKADKTELATKANQSDFVALQSGVTQNTQQIGTFQQRFADTDARIAQQKAAQQKTDATVAKHTAQLADHESRIQDLEANTSVNFGKLKSQVEQNRKRASAGIAGVAAMANIPQVTADQNFSIGAGVGNTDGESALSVGFSARATQNIVVKGAVSNDTQHNFVVGAGVSYGW
ncbi:hypothetical protein AXL65_02105 [Salmonella enterica subsp. enterica]|nr:hypothetical protein [Salmonella enterica subsp. enterica]